jgi:hypothetical protein
MSGISNFYQMVGQFIQPGKLISGSSKSYKVHTSGIAARDVPFRHKCIKEFPIG